MKNLFYFRKTFHFLPSCLLGIIFSISQLAYSQENPYGLAVEIQSPYAGTARITDGGSFDCPTQHWKPWGGDWAADLSSAGCSQNLYLKARGVTVPGGSGAQEIKARVIDQGYACASAVYEQGGLFQKYALYARYGTIWYEVGWVLFGHLDRNSLVYKINDEFNPANAYIGKEFYTSPVTNAGCWPDCHVHVEVFNHRKWPCYNLCNPYTNIASSSRIGIVGGTLGALGHCSNYGEINTLTNVARRASVNFATPGYNSTYDATKAIDGNVSTKWTTDGSSPNNISLILNLNGVYNIKEFKIKHAGANGEWQILNTEVYSIGVWNGSSWVYPVNNFYNSGQQNVTSHIVNTNAQYVYLNITNPNFDPNNDPYARIPEFEVYAPTNSVARVDQTQQKPSFERPGVESLRINAFPNPVNKSQVTFSMDVPEEQKVSIQIIDLNGKVLKSSESKIVKKGNSSLEMDVAELGKGMYFYRATTETGTTVIKKLLVE